MQIVSQNTNIESTKYILERALAFGRSAPELHSLLGGFGLFLAGESDTTPISEWIDEAVDNTAIDLVKDDSRIAQAQESLRQVRTTKEERHAIELSRCTEWVVLLEMFIEVVPDSSESAA